MLDHFTPELLLTRDKAAAVLSKFGYPTTKLTLGTIYPTKPTPTIDVPFPEELIMSLLAATYLLVAGTGAGSSLSRAVSGMPKKKAASATRAGYTQSPEGCRIAEMVDDFAGDKTAHRGADALDGGDSPLSHVVTACAAHEVR